MKEIYDIIVLAGQSNAEGYGVGEVSEEYEKDDRVLWLNDRAAAHFEKDENGNDFLSLNYPAETEISIAEEPTGAQGKTGKLALSFAKCYVKSGLLKPNRKLLIVNAARDLRAANGAIETYCTNGFVISRIPRSAKTKIIKLWLFCGIRASATA